MPEHQDERTIPLFEEQVHVTQATVVSDQFRVTTSGGERPVLIEDVVERGALHVDRVAVDRAVATAPEPRHEGNTLIVSIVEERLVVEKRLFVIEELRITHSSTTHDVAIPETVRTMRATVERIEPATPTGREIDG